MNRKQQIDDFKDYMFQNRNVLGNEKVNEMEKEFIEMVKQYKTENPNDFKNIRRWRNWYKSVKDDLHKKKVPQEELAVLQYHLETFRVKDSEYAVQRLQNWIDRMASGGYSLNERIIERINNTLNRYGYSFKG